MVPVNICNLNPKQTAEALVVRKSCTNKLAMDVLSSCGFGGILARLGSDSMPPWLQWSL